MKHKIVLIALAVLVAFAGSAAAAPKPVIKADKTYLDINSGLYILKGNCYLEVRNRIITCNEARVSVGSLEVWGFGGVRVTQGDITFTGESVYVYGIQDRAKIEGGVAFSRTGLTITADRAEFNWKTKVGVFSGKVTVTQGDKAWTADALNYNVDTNTIL